MGKLMPATRLPKICFCTLWPCDLDRWSFDLKTISPVEYHSLFPIPSLKTLGSFVFELCSGQTDTQSDRQTLRQTPMNALLPRLLSPWVITMKYLIVIISWLTESHRAVQANWWVQSQIRPSTCCCLSLLLFLASRYTLCSLRWIVPPSTTSVSTWKATN